MPILDPMDAGPDCTRCRHFVVTWRPETPRGCRLYGFEGAHLPAIVVRATTGEPCQGFEPRPGQTPTTPPPKGARWTA